VASVVSDAPSDLDGRLDAIHEHLAACLERPVERTASRLIAEAEAVARDLTEADLSATVVAKRLGHVRALLEEVEETGDEVASAHVDSAAELTVDLLETLD